MKMAVMVFFSLALQPFPAIGASGAVPASPLWHEWYTVSREDKIVSTYEETAERRPRDEQVAVTQKWVERVDGKKTEAYIGSVATDGNFAPVAFFVERTGGERAYKTDGRVNNGQLEVTFKVVSGAKAKTRGTTPVGPGTYLSTFVSFAVAKHLSEKGAFQFTALVEDDGKMNVEIKKGFVEIQGEEKKIGGESCGEALIRIDGSVQEWWITRQGKTCLVVFPDSGTRLELSSQNAVKKASPGI
jgi:hypothetical protein